MKLKDFLKRFENEDPEMEVVMPSSRWENDYNCTKIITIVKEYTDCFSTSLCNVTPIKYHDNDIQVLRIW
mgnify:FL=1